MTAMMNSFNQSFNCCCAAACACADLNCLVMDTALLAVSIFVFVRRRIVLLLEQR